MRWRPGKTIAREAALHQRRVAQQIRSARPPKEGGSPGGALAAKVRSRTILARKRWGAVIQWSKLGDTLTFFRRGTRRGQPARPLNLRPDPKRLLRATEKSAVRHFRKRERRRR